MDHSVCRPGRFRYEISGHEPRESRYRGQHRAAVDRIGKLHQVRIMRMRILASPQRLEGLTPLSEGVDEQRISLAGLAVMADWTQIASPAQLRVACRTRGRPSTTVLTMLDEAAIQH